MTREYGDMSLKELLKMKELSESDIQYNLAIANKYLELGNWSEASEYAAMALKINSNSVNALLILSKLQELKNDYNGAITILEKILSQELSPEIFLKIADLYLIDQNLELALNEVEKGLKHFSTNLQLLILKCRILERNGDIEECRKTFEKIINIDSNNPIHQYDYAVFLRNNGKHKEALQIFKILKEEREHLSEELNLLIDRFLLESPPIKQHFKVGARLLIQLGEQMIENETVALSELIKNSYDARSPSVDIIVDTDYEERGVKIGKIEIKDKGIGMTVDVIKNHWLLISTSMKLKQKKNKSTENVPLGEKGVGRLSAHRLGHRLVVETSILNEGKKTYLEVDWEKFEYDPDLPIDSVDVLLSEATENIEKQYTTLTITKLRNPDFWLNLIKDSKSTKNFKTKTELQKALFSMISPYKDIQKAFALNIEINGIPLKLDNVDEDFLKTIGTTKLELDFSQNLNGEWGAEIKTTLYPDFYALKSKPLENKLSEYDSKWLKEYLERANLPKSERVFLDLWNQDKLLNDFKDLWETQLFGLQSPGKFKMVVYGFSRDKSMNERVKEGLAKLFKDNVAKTMTAKDYFDSIKGVKIYRDGFRIFPYGEEKNDWLGLDQSATSSGTYDDLKSSNTTGFVALTGKDNQNLREKTNREGFISDSFSTVFFKICNQAVKLANIYIKREADALRGISKDINNKITEELEKEKREREIEIENMRKTLLEAATTTSETSSKETDKSIASTALNFTDQVNTFINTSVQQNKVLKSTIDDLLIDMDKLTELASLGMLVEAFTHEFELQSSKLKGHVTNLTKEYSTDSRLKRSFQSMQSILKLMDGYINYLAPSFQKERQRRSRLEIGLLLQTIFGEGSRGFINSRALRNNISVNIEGDEQFVILGNQGLLTQTFDNLYLNSEYWLNDAAYKGLISEKEIHIIVDSEEKKVTYWDNGRGIDTSIESVLFDAFESGKPNNEGRGLGLYISKTVLEMMNIKIYLDSERNFYDRRYKFVMDFSHNGG
ncbi:ATP-binding protein [Paenibacillus lautus]|uniref:ATP-binding protein n=1 Tax=Paenibacillus lautus TaxID=1401 RepID=UPI003D27B73A